MTIINVICEHTYDVYDLAVLELTYFCLCLLKIYSKILLYSPCYHLILNVLL